MLKKRKFQVTINDLNEKRSVKINDTIEIDPAQLELFKNEYFSLIDKYDSSVI